MDCIEATWAGDSGRQIVEGATVVISRKHPKVDKLRTCTVATRSRGRLELRPGLPDVDIENDTSRLDVEVNSNVAADNLARRLLKTTTLDVKRYGPPGKITDADMRRISSQEMAIKADCDPSSNSKKARKRRRQWERQVFAEDTDVVIGTLEMACDLQTEESPWTSPLILVDEAAQATEPMTIIPFSWPKLTG